MRVNLQSCQNEKYECPQAQIAPFFPLVPPAFTSWLISQKESSTRPLELQWFRSGRNAKRPSGPAPPIS